MESEAIGHLPHPSTLLKVGLASLAFAMGATGAEAAPKPSTDEAAVIHTLEHKLNHKQHVTVDADFDILWSDPGFGADQYQYLTRSPLVAMVDGHRRYFRTPYNVEPNEPAYVSILPASATKVFDEAATAGGKPIPVQETSSRSVTVNLHDKQGPTARVKTPDGGFRTTQVGTTSPAKPQAISLYGGKRFASTAMETAIENAPTLKQASNDIQTFLSQYNLKSNILQADLEQAPYNYNEAYTPLGESDLDLLKSYGSMLIDEWSKYPVSWVTDSHLQYIDLVKGLSVDGKSRAAAPDPYTETMYYDISYGTADVNYEREVLHHEFDHLITYNLYGTYTQPGTAWTSFNPPGFSYGNGGAACYQPQNTCLTGEHPVPGFVTGYATAAEAEDQAETYGYLMTDQPYHLLEQWVQTDPYLAQKVSYYEGLIQHIDPQMGGDYFNTINP